MDEITAVFKIFGPNLDRDEFTVGQAGARAGRSGDNDLVLPSTEISRHHMRFEWDNGQIAVRDLNSSNGVWYNDARIRADAPQMLQPGESIRVGPFVITLESINVPKKKKAQQQTIADLPVPTPPEPEPPPAPVEQYVPQTEPPPVPEPEVVVEAAPSVDDAAVLTQPPVVDDGRPSIDSNLEKADMEFAVAAPGQEVTPEPEPEQPARATKSRAKSSKDEKEDGAKQDEVADGAEKSFLFTPIEPDAPEKPAASARKEKEQPKQVDESSQFIPAIVPEKPKQDSDGAKQKSDDPFDRVPFMGGDGASLSPGEPLPPLPALNGTAYPVGLPKDASSWLKYLPSIYLDDDFTGRFLLIFEAMMSPDIWIIDNLELYFSPEIAPLEWVRWIASWFDIYIAPELPAERQRAILSQAGWLAARRGTRAGLERLLELYCGVRPEIVEDAAHFTVKLPLSESSVQLTRELLETLIAKNKPAFASFSLELS